MQNLDPRARAEVEAHGPVALRNHIAQNLGPGAFLPPASSGAMSSVAAGGGDEELGDAVAHINALYPADVVAYCRPAYGLQLVTAANARAKEVSEGERVARRAAREQLRVAEQEAEALAATAMRQQQQGGGL